MDEEKVVWLPESSLPAPRLQLRWRKPANKQELRFGDETWVCLYELVLPLAQYDIRRDSEDPERLRHGHWVSQISATYVGKGGNEPCRLRDGGRFVDRPFRDSAHAQWDTKLLGDLPIYVVSHNGDSALVEPWPGIPGNPSSSDKKVHNDE